VSRTRVAAPTIVVVAGRFPEFSQTFVVDHLQGLAEHGWAVHVAAREVDWDALAGMEIRSHLHGVHALSAPSRSHPMRRLTQALSATQLPRLGQLRSVVVRGAAYHARALRAVLDEIRPEAVHAHFAHNGILAVMASRGQYPVIVNFHGHDVLELPLEEGWAPFSSFLSDTHGVVHSSFLQRRVAEHLDVDLHRVTLGVDPSLFAGGERGPAWPEPLTLLTVGRLVPVKGHDVAIDALARLRSVPSSRKFRLVVIGDGSERPALELRANRLGVTDQVRFLGSQQPEEVARQMTSADVLLVPSVPIGGWEESFCRVAVEGMASGMAVIGTQTGGLAETIGAGGVVVAPGDAVALAEAVSSIVERDTPALIADRARGRASQFVIRRMWEEYDRVTRNVAGLP
jgi:glycosyltransferase involved in cell wall biosynthesis